MATSLKRLTVTLTREHQELLERLKRCYYSESEGEIVRLLIERGITAATSEIKENFSYISIPSKGFSLAGPSKNVDAGTVFPSFPFSVFLPNGDVLTVNSWLDSPLDCLHRVRISNSVTNGIGYLTADGYLYPEDNMKAVYNVKGKIPRERDVVFLDGHALVPVLLLNGYHAEITDGKELAFSHHGISVAYYYDTTSNVLYTCTDKAGTLVPCVEMK